jgi:hypothetical protein
MPASSEGMGAINRSIYSVIRRIDKSGIRTFATIISSCVDEKVGVSSEVISVSFASMV